MKHLLKKTKAATDRYHELSHQIKEIEKRMAEITELKEHIINYSRTKEIYTAYRESGYSRNYYEKNPKAILIHKAAKNRFNLLSNRNVPSIKHLNEEYHNQMKIKEALQKEHLRLKIKSREFVNSKENIDMLLGYDKHPTKQKNRTERGRSH